MQSFLVLFCIGLLATLPFAYLFFRFRNPHGEVVIDWRQHSIVTTFRGKSLTTGLDDLQVIVFRRENVESAPYAKLGIAMRRSGEDLHIF
jgi:hypothetical protein